MGPGLIIFLILAAFLLLGFIGWCLVHFGTIGEVDLDEPTGYVDQVTQTAYDADAWKHATPKVHHAE